MAKYNNEAQKILQAIAREAIRRYSSGGYTQAEKAKIKSAFQTGRVESNFTNSSRMTDHDSQGWRQERASLYKNPTNLKASTRRYFQEADKHYRSGMKSGDLAANVQRPAAQYRGRYAQHNRESEELFRKLIAGVAGVSAGKSGDTKAPSSGGGDTSTADLAARALLARSKNPGKQGSLLKDMLYLKSQQPAETAKAVQSTVKEAGQRAATPSGANPWKIPSKFGLTVTSGSRPGSITTSGNTSDHAGQGEGTMARDFSGSVAQMDKAAKAMARRFGISEKAIMKGGLFNVTKDGWRYQLIYRTNIGGNHYNHVHLGRRKA